MRSLLLFILVLSSFPSRAAKVSCIVIVNGGSAALPHVQVDAAQVLKSKNRTLRDARLASLGVTVTPFSIFEGALLQDKKKMVDTALQRIVFQPNLNAGDMALMWDAYQDQIQKHISNDQFGSVFHQGVDGSFVFQGYLGHMLVISPEGTLFRGVIPLMGENELWNADYAALKPYRIDN